MGKQQSAADPAQAFLPSYGSAAISKPKTLNEF